MKFRGQPLHEKAACIIPFSPPLCRNWPQNGQLSFCFVFFENHQKRVPQRRTNDTDPFGDPAQVPESARKHRVRILPDTSHEEHRDADVCPSAYPAMKTGAFLRGVTWSGEFGLWLSDGTIPVPSCRFGKYHIEPHHPAELNPLRSGN